MTAALASVVSTAPAVFVIIRYVGLVAIPFTLYFAWTKIGFRIVAMPTWSGRLHAAEGIGRLTLINMKDRSLAIFEAHAVFEGMSFPLIKFDPPLILKAYEAANVDIPEVSSYYVGNREYEWKPALDFQEIDIFLSTASKLVKCKHGAPPSRIEHARNENYMLVTTHTKGFNDRVYDNNVEYAIGYRLDGTQHTAFIDKHGFIDWEFAPNMMRPQDMTSQQAVRVALDASGVGKIIGHYFVQALGKDRP